MSSERLGLSRRLLSGRLLQQVEIFVNDYSLAVFDNRFADFPEEWPTLLQDLLRLVTEGNESQTNGALHVLNGIARC